MNKNILNILTALLTFSLVSIGVLALLSYLSFDILRLQLAPSKTITVTGLGTQNETNQTAMFTATLNATGDDKQAVNNELQKQSDELTRIAIEFGIEQNNIKTDYFNIYQEEIRDFNNPDVPVRKGPWMGNSNLSFSKIPTDQVQEFANLLANSGASNISGPNYGLDNMREMEDQLVTTALEDAKEKATAYAQSQNLSVGKILSIDTTSGNGSIGYPLMRGLGGGAEDLAFNPGESEVSKQVTVVYELK